jgi:hypothetical protein
MSDDPSEPFSQLCRKLALAIRELGIDQERAELAAIREGMITEDKVVWNPHTFVDTANGLCGECKLAEDSDVHKPPPTGSGWIAVRHQPPDRGEPVVYARPNGPDKWHVGIAYWTVSQCWNPQQESSFAPQGFTHWKPLGAPPNRPYERAASPTVLERVDVVRRALQRGVAVAERKQDSRLLDMFHHSLNELELLRKSL